MILCRIGTSHLLDTSLSSLVSKERNKYSPIKLEIALVLLDVNNETTFADEIGTNNALNSQSLSLIHI